MKSIQGSDIALLEEALEKHLELQKSVDANIRKSLTTNTLQIDQSLSYLASKDCVSSMEIDPYWPKWNSPWWHMTLLYEMGLSSDVPYMALQLLEDALENKYLHFFPFTESEIPAGRDPIADVLCQCAIGTAHRVLRSAGRDTSSMPWIREWFTKYQLPDGGYNCDEAVYEKNGRSSMISTIHIIESLLEYDDLSSTELKTLDKAVKYLLDRRLLRSLSKGDQIIDSNWVLLTFPRFYEIDILRTLHCVLTWSSKCKQPLSWSTIAEVFSLLHSKMSNRTLTVERQFYMDCQTRVRNADGSWQPKQEASVFPLLEVVGANGSPSPFLTKQWWHSLKLLKELRDAGLLVS